MPHGSRPPNEPPVMSQCQQLAAEASAGIAPALRAVDCLAGEATTTAFARLFGSTGALAPALTILLTLYIAGFALALLTGRSRLSLAALTPRMITLGLVLTFATSWIAYQSVLWTLAVGAPDQIASLITGSAKGSGGSASQIFADRMDLVFAAIAQIASEGGSSVAATGATPAAGGFTPTTVMWLGALLLLLGTVGILLTARIALAVLLAVGPVFIVLALFRGTRGLTAGWLRGLVMTALTPLYVVVGGGIVMELLVPVVAALRNAEGEVDARAAMALVVIAFVHAALMVLIGRVTLTMVGNWSVFGLARPDRDTTTARLAPAAAGATGAAWHPTAQPAPASRTIRAIGHAPSASLGPAANDPPSTGSGRRLAVPGTLPADAAPSPLAGRARGIGSRFRAVPHAAFAKGPIR